MKSLRILAATGGVVLALQMAPAGAAGMPSTNVAWLPAAADADVERAFALARQQRKPVLMYWGATWCPPCNQLKATLFNRQDFANLSRGFVAVHVDGDRPGAQKLGTRFQVSGYPTVVLFGADGGEITRLPGEVDAEQVVALLQQGMAGGRGVKAVLADAKAGRPLVAAEWRQLAFYSWATDEQQLVPKADLPGLLGELAVAAGAAAEPEVVDRLWLKALAESDDGKGIKADAALRERVRRLLADPEASRRQTDMLSAYAAEITRALSAEDSPERTALVPHFDTALERLQDDRTLSRGDRVSALIARLDLARLQPADDGKPGVPAALMQAVRSHVARDDREISDGYERQAVITAGAYALAHAGAFADSDALLKANLARSHSPYYLMSQLGSNARKQGRTDEALRWYEQAWRESKGPATRLQWGSSYLAALVDLAPARGADIERTASALIAEAGKDSGALQGRSVRSLQRAGKKLLAWNAGDKHAAALGRLRKQMRPLCSAPGRSASEQQACQAVLTPGPTGG